MKAEAGLTANIKRSLTSRRSARQGQYDGNPGTPDWDNPFGILPTPHLTRRDIREQRYLLHITKLPTDKPKGQPVDISLTIKMFGQWSTFDIPGLPIDEIKWPTYDLYMFRTPLRSTKTTSHIT